MLKRTMTRAHLQVHRVEWVSQSPYFARYQTQMCFVGVCAREEASIGYSKMVFAHTHSGVGSALIIPFQGFTVEYVKL
jgi:hypothetical protein